MYRILTPTVCSVLTCIPSLCTSSTGRCPSWSPPRVSWCCDSRRSPAARPPPPGPATWGWLPGRRSPLCHHHGESGTPPPPGPLRLRPQSDGHSWFAQMSQVCLSTQAGNSSKDHHRSSSSCFWQKLHWQYSWQSLDHHQLCIASL